MVISAALESGCSLLYSEDMQHGQKIDVQLMICNPFLG
ncbi:PilT protein domain protein (fragment) [Crenothrix polyspora]|uniref:PilT protein domain protein n=1 Tax=Crenothrix polyspora TaxID=360316 RepID=A0A1R4HA80_9GAMM